MSYIERTTFNNMGKSRESLEQALEIETEPSMLRGKALDFLARTYANDPTPDERKKAIPLCEESISTYNTLLAEEPQASGLKNKYADANMILGEVYLQLDQIEEARSALNNASPIYSANGDNNGMCNIYRKHGKISMKEDSPSLALTHFLKALGTQDDSSRSCHDPVTAVSLEIAEAYLRLDQPEAAKPYLERFRDGIIQDHHTPETEKKYFGDSFVRTMKPGFQKVKDLYSQQNIEIDGFDKLTEKFN